MGIQQLAEKVKGEMSGYDLAGYVEVCVPVFKRTLHCLMARKGQLPVITDFVLHYYSLGVTLEDITNILGMEKEQVNDAWWDLIARDFIDIHSKKLNEIGDNYLRERQIEKVDTIPVAVSIDGLIGSVKMDTLQLMKDRNVREQGLRALRPTIADPNEGNIEFGQVKRVINDYKKIDDEEYYEGDLLDISRVEGSRTFFKRLNVILYSNEDSRHTRISGYEGGKQVDDYEQALIKLENSESCLIKSIPSAYPDQNLITELNIKGDELGPGTIFDTWAIMIRKANKTVIISLPLIELCSPDDVLIDLISDALKRGVQITLIASGREYGSGYQQAQYEKLREIKNEQLQLVQITHFWNKFILIDSQEGLISDFIRRPIYLATTFEGYVEEGYLIDESTIKKIETTIISVMEPVKKLVPKSIDKQWLIDMINAIERLVNEIDEKLKNINGMGWFGDSPIPELGKFRTIPIAGNEASFKEFINAFNKSLSESVDFTGKKSGNRKYFWGEFKDSYPSVQRVLHKIRMYRNLASHLEIDIQYKPVFFKFLDEDLAGRRPEFVKNGFLYLQIKLFEELQEVLKNEI